MFRISGLLSIHYRINFVERASLNRRCPVQWAYTQRAPKRLWRCISRSDLGEILPLRHAEVKVRISCLLAGSNGQVTLGDIRRRALRLLPFSYCCKILLESRPLVLCNYFYFYVVKSRSIKSLYWEARDITFANLQGLCKIQALSPASVQDEGEATNI